jgi:hypothetical protein
MARIRTIKPELARHEPLFQLERETGLPIRFAWALLPTVCDREGRFKWRPRDLKLDILPYDECDFSRVLDAWLTRGQVCRYRVKAEWYGCIPTWKKHQSINNKEPSSNLPGIDEAEEIEDYRNQAHSDPSPTREQRDDDASGTRDERDSGHAPLEGKGREGKGKGKDASATRAELVLHDTLPTDSWHEWVTHRRSKRWPCDDLTLRKQLAVLMPFDTATQRRMLDDSIQAGWQGLFPPKAGNGVHVTSKPLKLRTADEIEAEERARGDYDAQH